MAFRTGISAMLAVPAGGIAVVLARAALMARGTLGVDIKRAGHEIRRGLAAMASGAGAGAVPIDDGRTALGIEIGRDAEIGGAVHVACAIMAGPTDRIDRTEAKHGVRVMGANCRRLAVTGGTARVHGSHVGTMTGGTIAPCRK